MSERVWVDHPEIKYFVENICTAFETNLPTQHHFTSGGFFVGPGAGGSTSKSSGEITLKKFAKGKFIYFASCFSSKLMTLFFHLLV